MRYARRLSKVLLLAAFPLITVSASPPDLAVAAASRMIATCTSLAAREKMPPLSIAVLDASGTLVAFQRQDGASPVSADVAVQKARSALRAGSPTSALAPVAAADAPTRDALVALGILTIPGGIPLLADTSRLIGAVGVSGASPAVDERCAGAAVAAFGGAMR